MLLGTSDAAMFDNLISEMYAHQKREANCCVLDSDVLGEELHSDPDARVHEALDQPGVNVQVSDETNQPDDHERCSQHHFLPELLQQEEGKETGGYRWQNQGRQK